MSTPPSLTSLVGPLRYACANDFAQLPRVKGLEGLVEAAASAALREGLEASVAQRLRGEAKQLAVAVPLPNQKAALQRLIALLAQVGVALPPPLAGLGRGAVGAAATRVPDENVAASTIRAPKGLSRPETPTGRPPATSGSKPVSESASKPSRKGSREASGASGAAATEVEPKAERTRAAVAKTKRSAAPRRAGGTADSAADEPMRQLSISPRSGPLATPLNRLGFRYSPRLAGLLKQKGMRTAGDVLFLLPRCYEDRRRIGTIAELVPGERGVTIGTVARVEDGGRGRPFRAVLADSTGSIAATHFHGGPWLKAKFPLGKRLILSGEVRATQRGWEMSHPDVEPIEEHEAQPASGAAALRSASSSAHFGRVVPVYPGFERHEQRALRQLAFRIVQTQAAAMVDPLPDAIRARLELLPLSEALAALHFPAVPAEAVDTQAWLEALNLQRSPAHQRLAFDELFFLQLGLALRRQGVKREAGIAFEAGPAQLAEGKRCLPFALTGAQERVLGEIFGDMARPEPMSRLVQGDVGSGKTAVAAVAALAAVRSGYQVAVMAPTELLAEQHFRTFARFLGPGSPGGASGPAPAAGSAPGLRLALFTGSQGTKERREAREALARGEVQVAVGTHALLEEGVGFSRLGLVIVDEQHRFGVLQRQRLASKGQRPDLLVMTATPIPRTLAMALYGDLDLSVIDELPPGRTPIVTRAYVEAERAKLYELLEGELSQGRQAYVVHPLVEESEVLDVADATQGAEALAARFPHRRVGLLHGRQKPEEKERVMAAFRAHELDLLVCTTVIEVGVDVPNASVMVIEAAERFGLSQLHQLRGRVGRGAAKSYCCLVSGGNRSQASRERLAVMERTSNGFELAEVDLELRGPGELLGTRQSGLPELAVANLARDGKLLAQAREHAEALVRVDPHLSEPAHRPLAVALEERWEGRLALGRVG